MKKREKLTRAERFEIAILWNKGYSKRDISKALQRSPNTISYEIKKNMTHEMYDPVKAHRKAMVKRKYRRYQWSKIENYENLEKYIIQGLRLGMSPKEISGRIRRENKPLYISKTAIYKWLRSVYGERYQYLLPSKKLKKWRKKKKTKREMIPQRTSISMRHIGADNRSRYGHWEVDTITSGRKGRGGLAVAYERKSRFVSARKILSFSSKKYIDTVKEMLNEKKTKSITFDNGIENKRHYMLNIPTFFCDPYSSWQKGGIEHANKMIRRYFPKRTDWSMVSQEEIDCVISMINNKPREILGYRTALEVAREGGVLYEKTPTSVVS